MGRIAVIGMGPGGYDYVLPAAVKKARQCEVLVGSSRWLKMLAEIDPRSEPIRIEITSDLEGVIERVKSDHRDRLVGFLVSGDPGVYSLMAALRRHYTDQEIEVIPGISSVQYLFAKVRRTWQDCRIVSLHGRSGCDILEEVSKNRTLAVLTDSKNDPAVVAGCLIQQGVNGKRVHVGSDLAGPRESIVSGSLELISGMKFERMSVMVIEDEQD